MDVLKLPTDNLYIFLTLGGLLMFVFFVSKLLKSLLDIRTRINKIKNESTLVKIDSDSFIRRFNLYSNVIDMRIEAFEKKYNVKFRNPNDVDNETEHETFSLPDDLDVNLTADYILDYEKMIEYISTITTEK